MKCLYLWRAYLYRAYIYIEEIDKYNSNYNISENVNVIKVKQNAIVFLSEKRLIAVDNLKIVGEPEIVCERHSEYL